MAEPTQAPQAFPGSVSGANLGATIVVTAAPTIALPFSSSPGVFVTDFFILLNQSVTISGVTGTFTAGNEIVVTFLQDNAGSHSVTWPANFIAGGLPSLQTGANTYTAVVFQYCGLTGNAVCPANSWLGTDISPSGGLPSGGTSPSGVPEFLVETPSGGVAGSANFALAGVTPRVVTTTSDTILVTDRAGYVTYSNASAIAVSIPQSGTSGFANNFIFGIKNLGTGAVTFTPSPTSTIDGQATLVVTSGVACTIYSDNTNYFSRCHPYTLDTVPNPVNNASFTFPATEGLTLAGTQPASVSGAGTAGGTLMSVTAPQGGNSTTTTGGAGANLQWQVSTGGNSAAATPNAAAGNFIFVGANTGTGGFGTGVPSQFQFRMSGLASNGTGWGGTASAPSCCTGLFATNTDSTAGNTLNRFSPPIGLQAHMIEGNTDTVVSYAINMNPATPGSGSLTQINTNNPDITILHEVISQTPGNIYWEFQHGGVNLSCNGSGAGVCGDGYIFDSGASLHIGHPTLQGGHIIFQTANPGAGVMDLTFVGHGNSGTTAAFAGDDNKNTNGTWVWGSEMVNVSGGTIADGTLVKMGGTPDQITTATTTDSANLVVGIVVVPQGGTCANAAVCHVARSGALNGVIKLGSGSCAIGDWVTLDPTTTSGQVTCIPAGSGPAIGIAESAQASVGSTVDVLISLGLNGTFSCTNVTPVTVNTSTTNDQNLMACTLYAGRLNFLNRSLKIFSRGLYSTPAASAATINYKAKLCTVSGCASGTVVNLVSITSSANPGSVTNNGWNSTVYATTQTKGATAAFEAGGSFTIDLGALTTAADSIFNDTNTATVGTIDATGQLFLQITGAFSAASASNSMTQRQLVVELVNP